MSLPGQQEVNESAEQNDGVVSEELGNLTIQTLDEKYEETIKTIAKEHMLNMESLKKEIEERCDRIDEKCKQEWADTKQKLDKFLIELSEHLKKEKEEGRKLVCQLEEQSQQHANDLQLLHEEYSTQLGLIQEENHRLRTENDQAKQEQRKRENQLELEHIRLNRETLDRHLRVENARSVIGEIINILRPVYDVRMSLKKIKIICFYSRVDGFAVLPGELDPNFRDIKERVESFDLHVVNYWNFIKNTSYTTTQFSETCSMLIREMKSKMDSEDLMRICVRVPRAIESGSQELIGKFDNILKEFSKDFDE